MQDFASARIRSVILANLAARGIAEIGEQESLFSSGLLDSLAATEVLVALETDYGLDLTDEDFDILAIDTLDGIERMVTARRPVEMAAALQA